MNPVASVQTENGKWHIPYPIAFFFFCLFQIGWRFQWHHHKGKRDNDTLYLFTCFSWTISDWLTFTFASTQRASGKMTHIISYALDCFLLCLWSVSGWPQASRCVSAVDRRRRLSGPLLHRYHKLCDDAFQDTASEEGGRLPRCPVRYVLVRGPLYLSPLLFAARSTISVAITNIFVIFIDNLLGFSVISCLLDAGRYVACVK